MIRPALAFEPEDAAAALAGLVAIDAAQLTRLRPAGFPSVYDLIRSGRLRYDRADPDERWQTYEDVLRAVARDGYCGADCEDISALAAAEYRVTGVDPGARVHVYKTGPSLSHVVVARSNGSLEDPNIAAGMTRGALAGVAQLPLAAPRLVVVR